MTRIKWIEDDEATGELAALYAEIRQQHHRGEVPPILRTMSGNPGFLRAIHAASQMHFTDGHLSRAQHEMIASHVAALNRCHY